MVYNISILPVLYILLVLNIVLLPGCVISELCLCMQRPSWTKNIHRIVRQSEQKYPESTCNIPLSVVSRSLVHNLYQGLEPFFLAWESVNLGGGEDANPLTQTPKPPDTVNSEPYTVNSEPYTAPATMKTRGGSRRPRAAQCSARCSCR